MKYSNAALSRLSSEMTNSKEINPLVVRVGRLQILQT